MDFSLNSSVVLAAIVGLWLIWVAPYLFRRLQPLPAAGTANIALSSTAIGDAAFQRGVMNMSTGNTSQETFRSAPDEASAAPAPVQQTSGTFRVRWDRLAIATAGCLALLTALVTSAFALAGMVSPIVPVVALLVFVASVAVLRMLAVRGRRRRAAARPPVTQQPAAPAQDEGRSEQRPTRLFDAEDNAGAEENAKADKTADDAAAPETSPTRFSAAELRAAALAVAAEAGDQTIGTGAPWQPVDVPKPTYVEAPKAEREDPAPLDLPEAPKPQTKTPIKNGAAAPKVETTSAPRMNLDDILQRRRA